MKTRVFLGVSLLLCSCPYLASAARNSNGAIIVHTNDAYAYLSTTVCEMPLGEPASCEDAITRTDKASGSVVWLLASFAPESDPSVTGVYFGLDFDDALLDPSISCESCGPPGTLQIPDMGWPAPGTGNTVGFPSPIAGDRVFPFYVFVIDNPSATAGAAFGPGVNPLAGYAAFYDDSHPPREDPCTRFGKVRWFEAGSNTCPIPPQPGACCLPDATCQVVTYQNVCDALSGVYQGDGSDCGQPCGACCYWLTTAERRCVVTTAVDCADDTRWDQIQVRIDGDVYGSCWSMAGAECALSAQEAGTKWWCQNPRYTWHKEIGTCCVDDQCVISDRYDCADMHGIWIGPCPLCDPNPCSITSTMETSWGTIKRLFR